MIGFLPLRVRIYYMHSNLTTTANLFAQVLESFKLDLTNPNFIETPQRMAKAYAELLYGHTPQAMSELQCLIARTFPQSKSSMVVVRNIRCTGLCPHHLLPVHYSINFGYINSDKVIGLSKIPRILQILTKRAVMQEDLAVDIGKFFMTHLQPLGIGVHLKGNHACMQLRGVEERDSDMIVMHLEGDFNLPHVKSEFQQLITL